MIDFENMKPGTLLLLDHDPYNRTDRIVEFQKDNGMIEIKIPGRARSTCFKSTVVCVVPPKPEIEGWEAVEFREPKGAETFQGTSASFNCQGVMSRGEYCPFEHKKIGRRRWILKRKTEQVETLQKEEVMPAEIKINLLEKPMKETSFRSKLKKLLWWSVAPPTLLAKHAALKPNWIGWACMAAAVSWYAWLASTGQVEVPTLQSPLKW